jgi:outer membrane protein TolC
MRVPLFMKAVVVLLAVSPALAARQEAPGTVKLAELAAEAERVHPSIRAAAKVVEARRTRVPQARALPDPSVSVGWMGDIAPFKVQEGDPSSYRGVGAMQEFPYPGKRKLRAAIAEKDIDAELATLEEVRREVRAEVKAAYYELWSVDQAVLATQKNKALLAQLASVAEEHYKVGKGLQQDVLRAQVEITRVLQRLAVLEQRRQTLAARLNSLLLRPTDAPLGPLAPVEKSPLEKSLDELLAQAGAQAPELLRQEHLIEQDQMAIDLARREYFPDFQVGYTYQQRPAMPDMHGVTFGIKVPVFYRGKQRQAVSEATLTLESSRQVRTWLHTALQFQVKEQFLAARTAEELLALYRKALVPQTTLALESALASYQVGSLDFLSVLTNFLTLLDYETSYFEELARYQTALARLEQITGFELAK